MQPVSEVLSARGRGRGPWKKEGQEFNELRRPRTVPPVGGNKSGTEQTSTTSTSPPPDPGAKGDSVALPRTSRLSADAKEFVPKCYNVEQFEEAGGGGDAYPDTYPVPEHLSENFLSDVIHDLTLNPGNFNSSASILIDLLMRDMGDTNLYQRVVDIIVEKSIILPNFRYNGARLLTHFRNALPTNLQQDFRNILLRRCQDENVIVEKKEKVNFSQTQGFALFMAELFIQMNVSTDTVERIAILGVALFEVLKILLSDVSRENIKCVCQALKLAGLALDEQNTRIMDAIFERLTEIQNCCENDNTVHLIASVIKLRQNAWRPPTLLPSTIASSGFENEGMSHFYLPNGDTLSPEESRFLQDNIEPCEELDDYGEEGAMCNPSLSNYDCEDVEDEDFDEAYEAFLKFSKQTKKSS